MWVWGRLNPNLDSYSLGRSMSWMINGLLLSLVVGAIVFPILPRNKGYFWVVVSVTYAVFCAWNIYGSYQANLERAAVANAIEDILGGKSPDSASTDGKYGEYVRLMQENSERAMQDWQELDDLTKNAYATFDFVTLPQVTECHSAEQAWLSVGEKAKSMNMEMKSRYDKLPEEIAALDVPEDFKRGLLEGASESEDPAMAANSEILGAAVDQAQLQIDACRLIAKSTIVFEDGSPLISEPEHQNEYENLIVRDQQVNTRVTSAYKRIEALEEQARTNIEKHK